MIGSNKGAYRNRRKARFRIKLCCWLYRHGLYGLAEKVNLVWYEYMLGKDLAAAVMAAEAEKTAGRNPQTGERTHEPRGGDYDR